LPQRKSRKNRPTKRIREGHPPPTQSATDDTQGDPSPSFKKVFGVIREDSHPVPYPLLALIGTALSEFAISGFASKHVVCPSQSKGFARVIMGLAVGLPVGIGLGTLLLLGLCFYLWTTRTDVMLATVRTTLERAAIGAIYGTILLTISSIDVILDHPESCEVKFIGSLGDGAAWGTAVGFAFSFPLLFNAIAKSAYAFQDRVSRTATIAGLMVTVVAGLNWTIVVTALLIGGKGWGH
jgi:hypothetical protein